MYSSGRCEKGMVRQMNQDSIFIHNDKFYSLPNLYIVADGMGGHKSGEVASYQASLFFKEYFMNQNKDCNKDDILDLMVEAVCFSNQKIFELARENEKLAGMGTTFTAVSVLNRKMYAVHVGDSRVYMLDAHSIRQVTTDHSLVAELVKRREITAEEAEIHPQKNIITRALGTSEELLVDTFIEKVEKENFILMCSDGLSNMVCENEMLAVVKENADLEICATKLLNIANERGGFDNISFILISGKEC